MGKVVIGDRECLEGEMSNETRQELEHCKGKMAVVMEETTTTTSDAICVSRTTHELQHLHTDASDASTVRD